MFSFLAFGLLLAFSGQDYERGVALIESGRADLAVEPLLRAAGASPNDARVFKALAVAYASSSNYAAAEPAFGRACALAPRLADACYFHARALYALNRFEASLAVLDRLSDPHWKVELARAEALEALSRFSEAETRFHKAVSACNSRSADPAVALARFLIRQGRYAEAAPPLNPVLERFPNSADAHTLLGRILLEDGKLAAAAAHLETAVSLAPGSAQAHLLLAKAYVRLGRSGQAEPHFKAAEAAETASQGGR